MVEALLGLFTGPSLSRFLFTLHIIACNLLFARHAWRLYLAIWVVFAGEAGPELVYSVFECIDCIKVVRRRHPDQMSFYFRQN